MPYWYGLYVEKLFQEYSGLYLHVTFLISNISLYALNNGSQQR